MSERTRGAKDGVSTGHPTFEAGAARNGSSAAFTIVQVFGQSKGRLLDDALLGHSNVI
jgi:hypothetical protein